MSYPIINNREKYQGATFFQDSLSLKNWFIAPTNNSWQTLEPVQIGERTIINARKEYITDNDIIIAFSQIKGGATITPLSITGYQHTLTPNFSFSSEHAIQLSVIDNLPYPSLLFSATLLHTAADYNTVIHEINGKLANNNLLKGELTIRFLGMHVTNRSVVTYNQRKCLTSITDSLQPKEKTKWNAYDATREYITSHLASLVTTSFTPLTDNEKDKLVDYLSTTLINNFIAQKSPEPYFDGAIRFEKVALRSPLELEAKDTIQVLLNSTIVTESLHLKDIN